MHTLNRLLAGIALGLSAAAVSAAPATYKMVVDNVVGTLNAVALNNATVTITINADTTAVVSQPVGFGGPGGNCVTGPGTVQVAGGPTGTFVSGSAYFCANTDGDQTGVYASLAGASNGSPIHGSNGGNGTGSVQGAPLAAPGITLTTNFGPVPYKAATIHSHSATLVLSSGGSYTANRPEAGINPNTTASTFTVSLVGPPVTAATASIPTLSEWGLIFMASLVGMFGMLQMRKRR